ncbi:MAG: hypothetical protein LBF22_03610, partial [Deltaproteobacteria bacterium]|nr:hypothetical protein [Deltaproteobacteria bacterium]
MPTSPEPIEIARVSFQGLRFPGEDAKPVGPLNLDVLAGQTVLISHRDIFVLERLVYYSMAWAYPPEGHVLWDGKDRHSNLGLKEQCLFNRNIGLVHRPLQLLSQETLFANLMLYLMYNLDFPKDVLKEKASQTIQRFHLESWAYSYHTEKLPEKKRR